MNYLRVCQPTRNREYVTRATRSLQDYYLRSMRFIPLPLMSAVGPAHVALVEHDLDVGSRAIPREGVEVEAVHTGDGRGEHARGGVEGVADVDRGAVVGNGGLFIGID